MKIGKMQWLTVSMLLVLLLLLSFAGAPVKQDSAPESTSAGLGANTGTVS